MGTPLGPSGEAFFLEALQADDHPSQISTRPREHARSMLTPFLSPALPFTQGWNQSSPTNYQRSYIFQRVAVSVEETPQIPVHACSDL